MVDQPATAIRPPPGVYRVTHTPLPSTSFPSPSDARSQPRSVLNLLFQEYYLRSPGISERQDGSIGKHQKVTCSLTATLFIVLWNFLLCIQAVVYGVRCYACLLKQYILKWNYKVNGKVKPSMKLTLDE